MNVSQARKRLAIDCFSPIVLCVVLGCADHPNVFRQTSSRGKIARTKAYDDITQMAVFANTPLLDSNNDGYPEGVLLKVYLYGGNEEMPVRGSGAMRFRLIRRTMREGGPGDEDLKLWPLPPDEVARAAQRDRFGLICYLIALYWQDVRPRGPGICIRGEFIRPDQKIVRSRPLSLPVPTAVPGEVKEKK